MAAWSEDPDVSAASIDRLQVLLVRFARYLDSCGVESLTDLTAAICTQWVHAPVRSGSPPAASTMHARRHTIRATLRTLRALNVDAADPTIDIELPARGGLSVRPLSNTEIDMCRLASFTPTASSLKRPAAWALAEATATTGDLTAVTGNDINIDEAHVTIRFGSTRTATARTVAATEWGATILQQRRDEIEPTGRLCYDGNKPGGSDAAQAATCGLLRSVLHVTGLSADPTVRPGSIRLWRINCEFASSGSLEHAARIAGARSLDAVARQVDHDWQQQ